MELKTLVGALELKVWYGKDPESGKWGCPIRQLWGLKPHQRMSPALEDQLAFTITSTASYTEAAALAQKWGCSVYDSTLHALTQRLGLVAEEKTQERLAQIPKEQFPQRKASELGSCMLDGYLTRQRGPGWGKKKTKKNRVEWHEVKLGLFYLNEQALGNEDKRGMIEEKVVVGWQGEPGELAKRLHWEALERGLGRAREILVVGDGAAWIWHVARDRWKGATEVLDFYHASEHLWKLGRALFGEKEAKEWVENGLHELRHGKEQICLSRIAAVREPKGERGETVREQKTYFKKQARRMNYREMAKRGWPIGSGAVESACSGQQNRFKRRGQFWTRPGLQNLALLREAGQNKHWEELWLNN